MPDREEQLVRLEIQRLRTLANELNAMASHMEQPRVLSRLQRSASKTTLLRKLRSKVQQEVTYLRTFVYQEA